jgi:DNA repair exonuclease SbcCD ATPase subunit
VAGVAPHVSPYQAQLPLTFCLDISSEKAQNNFIINQQELQINELKQVNLQLQQDREKHMKEIDRVNKLNVEMFNCCQSQYSQSQTYHQNFKSLEKEFNRLQQSTQLAINACFQALQKVRKAPEPEPVAQGKRKKQP